MKAGRRVAWTGLVLALVVAFVAIPRVQASGVDVEINGRDFYGTLFMEGGEMYAPLDVVGPLLFGPEFSVEGYDLVLRRATFRFVPAGSKTPVRFHVAPCLQRGSTLYAPLKPLVKSGGGTYTDGTPVRLAYPPVAVAPPTPPRPSPTPTPARTTSTTVAVRPPTWETAPLEPAAALAAARTANRGALGKAATIRKIELYHPVSPDPAEAIPRTDLAGVKVFVKKLKAGDQAWITLYSGPERKGQPLFERHLKGFRGQDLEESRFFVRLPMPVLPGWYTLHVDLNHREQADYRFITY